MIYQVICGRLIRNSSGSLFAAELINNDMKTIYQKRTYEKPAMQVYELSRQPQLLAGSGDGGLNPQNPFTPGNDPLANL